MAEATQQDERVKPRWSGLLSALTSFGPLVVLTVVTAFQIDDFFEPPAPVLEPPTYYPTVAVTMIAGEAQERSLQLTGQAVPEREIALRVESDARVVRIPVRLEERVVPGQTVCELRYSDSPSSVALTSPIAGQVHASNGAPGSVLRSGSTCALIVDTSSMIVRAQVRPHVANTIVAGDFADVAIAGENRQAHVHYVHPVEHQTDEGLRTLELHPENVEGIKPGDTATIDVRTQQMEATVIPQSALIMVPGRGLSVQLVTGEGATGVVVTVPVQIIAAKPDGVYVAGLPKAARLIIKDGHKAPASEGEVVRISSVS